MLSTLRTAVVAAALTLPALSFASTWELDPSHSQASFAVKHLKVATVRGEMGKVTGVVQVDDKDPTRSSVEASVDTAAIDTRDEQRDAHLRSPDFFDVAKYPAIKFKSKKVQKAGKSFKVLGDLTIRDVTKEVTLDVLPSAEIKDPMGNTKRAFTATTRINRTDYGLKWNKALEGGGLLVSEEVDITLDLQAAKKAEAPKT